MLVCPKCHEQTEVGAPQCAHCGEALLSDEMAALAKDANHLVGKVLNGKYEVLSILGRGGMGVVYKVRHLILPSNNLFALKILHPDLSTDSQFRTRFLREVEVAMGLTHENVVQIRDFGATEGHLLFFTMDYFEGETLGTVLKRTGSMPVPQAVQLVRQILAALGEAHKRGVVPRDLKPDNVLLRTTESGNQVKILDFGIAKLLAGGSDGSLTQGTVVGSPKYMSPEQASGEAVDQRSDLYSLGVILFELLTGTAPFIAKTTRMILMQHLTAEVPKFEEKCPGLHVPVRLKQLVFSLLEKDPAKRPSSAAEVVHVLDGDATLVSRAVDLRRTLCRVAIVAVSLVLAIVAGGGFSHWRSSSASADGTPAHISPALESLSPPSPETSSPSGSSAPPSSRGRLHCRICSRTFFDGELEGNTHHDLPLAEN